MNNSEYVYFLDIETTGKKPNHDRAIEVAVVEFTKDGPTGRNFHVYVDPQMPIDPEATAVHGIKDEDLRGKPLFKDILEDLKKFIRGKTVVAHNGIDFDFRILDREFNLANSDMVFSEVAENYLDSLLIARRIRKKDKNSLDALCDDFKIDRSARDFHGALLDSTLTGYVWFKLLEEADKLGINLSVDHEKDLPRQQPMFFLPAGTPRKAASVALNDDDLARDAAYRDALTPKPKPGATVAKMGP